MADNLPDEILAEILGPALRVSDEAFSDTSDTTIFMSFTESSSAFLLVCKAWLRVSTPLLYNVVVLRSKAQAQALAATLKSNPDLGRFIKKLRVEGGYAISMHKILQTSTNISHIFLSLKILSDNACGLCRGLSLIDPQHVILYSPRYLATSAAASKLIDTLETCITTWTRLAVFDYPTTLIGRPDLGDPIAEALSKAPNLTTLVISGTQAYFSGIPPSLREIAKNPSLQRILFKPPLTMTKSLIDTLKSDAKMKALFQLPDERALPTEMDVPVPNRSMRPVQLPPGMVLDDSIWSRVLYFAFDRTPRVRRTWYERTRRPSSSYLAPLLVSKKFMQLGIPHLYDHPSLHTNISMTEFAAQLADNPHLRHHVRHLTITHSGDLAAFKSIISHTPALVELHGGYPCSPVPWKAFNDLCDSAGAATLISYQTIPVAKASQPVSTAVFSRFPEMQSFWWSSTTVFKTAPKSIPAGTFDTLVNLTVDNFDASFMTVLSHMELPSLRTATFSPTASGGKSFLNKHGSKLLKLTVSVFQLASADLAIFHNCPSLTVLSICCNEKTLQKISDLKPTDKHASLERMIFKLSGMHRMKQTQRDPYGRFFTSLNGKSFPALQEVEHPFCSWPTTDLEIQKSHWVRWAEALQNHNIQLVGPMGTQWRRRLKFVAKKATKNA